MKRRALSVIGAGVAILLVYGWALRPAILRWGATTEEVRMALPGDEVLPGATASATRAITIEAPVEQVWPWIAQIGQGRGGFYSYTWLENLVGCQIENAERIHPEWQAVKVGDGVKLHPAVPALPVAVVEPGRALVLGGPGIPERNIPPTSWAFVLLNAGAQRTRLLIRWRSQTPATLRDLVLNKYLLEPIHFTMERRMMIGIKERAERSR